MSVTTIISDAADALVGALTTVPGLRVYRDPGAVVDPPCVVLGPPALTWAGLCDGPTSARFTVYLVVAVDERALEKLWILIPQAGRAIDTVADAAVMTALPGTYVSGDLPCYELTVEVSL